jgi:hypothetical protein
MFTYRIILMNLIPSLPHPNILAKVINLLAVDRATRAEETNPFH